MELNKTRSTSLFFKEKKVKIRVHFKETHDETIKKNNFDYFRIFSYSL